MATPQLSPGVLIREVDLTVNGAENVLDNLGAMVPLVLVRSTVSSRFQTATVHQHFWNSSRRIVNMSIG